MSQVSDKDIEFIGFFHDPVAMVENLIPENYDAPHTWNLDCKCLTLYNYQHAMLSYESMYADDYRLSPEQNFKNKIGAGKIFNISARAIGKSLIGMDIDSALSTLYYDKGEGCLASFDDFHLGDRTERIANIIEGHPFFQIYHLDGQKKTINRGHKFALRYKTGYKILAVNENVTGKSVGTKFHGKHYWKLWYDEYSYATEEGKKKRVDSGHLFGYIPRYFGIPEARIGSPLGAILHDKSNKNWICRLPQFVRPDWGDSTKQDRIKEFGSESCIAYKLNVKGELIEGTSGRFDMQRIRELSYNPKIHIKRFEVTKENFDNFEDELAITRLPCKKVFIASDIGTTGSPSEIIIIFYNNKKYKYHYNISLYKLTTQEQAQVFKWLYDKMGTAFISLDCTAADGRSIADELVLLGVPDEYITRCQFNSNIVVDFETDEKGRVKRNEKGEPLEKKERSLDWACERLDYLFYNGLMEIPNDDKFFTQFPAYFCLRVGHRQKYGSSSGEDHLVQSFQCFALSEFDQGYRELKNKRKKRRSLGVITRE